jgi:KaiC/GvpD/RAD55 family RecA-like ATPase
MPGKGLLQSSSSPAFEGLPDELTEFLSRDTYSLLIKGDSGTGKTILALTILKSLLPLENPLYLSTRTSPLQLVENYPWVEEIFGPANPAAVGQSKEGEGWETLVDARLDEPNVIFERITNVLMDKQAPTVVIDSWESLADAVGTEALRTNIKVLQTWRERAGAKFIFVGEDPKNTDIDYMVEGVVVLKDRVAEGRRLREIVLSKLHGVQIGKPSYLFTLHGGTFAAFPGYSPGDYEFRRPLPVRFESPPGRRSRIPTGYAQLDSHIDGGFPPRSTAILEVDSRVDSRAALIFLSRTVQDWLSSGGRVVMQRPYGIERKFLNQYAKSFANRGAIEVEDGLRRAPAHKRGAKGRSRTLAILQGPDTRQTPDGLASEAELVVRLWRDSAGGENAERAKVMLKLLLIEGTLFVQCDLPSPALFGVLPSVSSGNPMMRLELVV